MTIGFFWVFFFSEFVSLIILPFDKYLINITVYILGKTALSSLNRVTYLLEGKRLLETRTEGARGIIFIIVGNGHDDLSSNPGRDRLHFT